MEEGGGWKGKRKRGLPRTQQQGRRLRSQPASHLLSDLWQVLPVFSLPDFLRYLLLQGN